MANSVQARKRARQAAKANSHNSALRSKFRTAIKVVRKAIDAGDTAKATEVFQASMKTIDIIADKKIVHKNKAARHKSRLAAAIKGLQAPRCSVIPLSNSGLLPANASS
ncbi:SSU ribosomal protein S20p [Candidatus Burkholderia brachyanthoides]|nr:SSU ribosomal protein S20p [Candidatus Burkholderia brachyanthoides]